MQRDIDVNVDVDSMPLAASLYDALKLFSRMSWPVDKMCLVQLACLLAVVSKDNTKKQILIGHPTGEEKTRVIRMIGTMLHVIHLVI